MTYTVAALVVAVGSVAIHGDKIDRESLLAIVESGIKGAKDINCQYELTVHWDKRFTNIAEAKEIEGPVHAYNGEVRVNSQGNYMIESSWHNFMKNSQSTIKTSFVKPRGMLYEKFDISKIGFGKIFLRDGNPYIGENTFFDFYLTFKLWHQLLDTQSNVVDEGEVDIDGVKTRRIRVYMGKNISLDVAVSDIYYLIMDRSMVYKYESFNGSKLVKRLVVNEAREFFGADGARAWLPLSATSKSFITYDLKKSAFVYLDEPSIEIKYRVMSNTVKINSGLVDGKLSLVFPPGTNVEDTIKHLSYESGQDLRKPAKTPREVNSRLDEYLKNAESDEAEVKANSRSRAESNSWFTTGLWLTVISTLSAVGVLKYKHRKYRR